MNIDFEKGFILSLELGILALGIVIYFLSRDIKDLRKRVQSLEGDRFRFHFHERLESPSYDNSEHGSLPENRI
jgi:hypothetical protein